MSQSKLYSGRAVCLRELGLRDGLQLTKSWPGTEAKKAWIEAAHSAGVRYFEVGSFLPAARYPQFADVRQLIEAVGDLDGAHALALALNERGVDDALATDLSELVIPVSATEAHSQANMRRSRESAVSLVRYAAEQRGTDGGPAISAAISVAFGCTIAGEVATDEVLRLADACADAGAATLAVADTVGYAGPKQVDSLCCELVSKFGDLQLAIHLHDTRGTAIANAHAALGAGIRILDGTLGGLGGCPFAPGATGNAVFEDLVFLCERSGFPTGIDLGKLIAVRSILENAMPEERLLGALAKAGPPATIQWQAQTNRH